MKSNEQKRTEVQARAEKWRALTPQEKWNLLDERLGKNVGARKERANLIASNPELNPVQIEAVKKVQHVQQAVPVKQIPNGSRVILR
jgi:hypothetical protein